MFRDLTRRLTASSRAGPDTPAARGRTGWGVTTSAYTATRARSAHIQMLCRHFLGGWEDEKGAEKPYSPTMCVCVWTKYYRTRLSKCSNILPYNKLIIGQITSVPHVVMTGSCGSSLSKPLHTTLFFLVRGVHFTPPVCLKLLLFRPTPYHLKITFRLRSIFRENTPWIGREHSPAQSYSYILRLLRGHLSL